MLSRWARIRGRHVADPRQTLRRLRISAASFEALLAGLNLLTGQWLLAAAMALLSAINWREAWIASRPASLNWSWTSWALACAHGIWGFVIAWYFNRFAPGFLPQSLLLWASVSLAVGIPILQTVRLSSNYHHRVAREISNACADAVPIVMPEWSPHSLVDYDELWAQHHEAALEKRQQLFDEWISLRGIKPDIRVRLIRLKVPAAMASAGLVNYDSHDLDIYEAMSDFSDNGWSDRS